MKGRSITLASDIKGYPARLNKMQDELSVNSMLAWNEIRSVIAQRRSRTYSRCSPGTHRAVVRKHTRKYKIV